MLSAYPGPLSLTLNRYKLQSERLLCLLRNMWGYAHGLTDLLLIQYFYDPTAYIYDGFIYPLFILLLSGWIYMVKQERDLAILPVGFVLLLSTMLPSTQGGRRQPRGGR
jgi:hypothetical protein